MGKQRMKCPKCGTENINDLLVEFEWPGEGFGVDGPVRTTTTLPKFLYYMRYPKDRGRIGTSDPVTVAAMQRLGILSSDEPANTMPKRILRILCDKCLVVHHRGDYTEVKPTRWGF